MDLMSKQLRTEVHPEQKGKKIVFVFLLAIYGTTKMGYNFIL